MTNAGLGKNRTKVLKIRTIVSSEMKTTGQFSAQ